MKHIERDGYGQERVFERKTLLINPGFQLSFLSRILGVAVFTLALFYGAKVFFFHRAQVYFTSMGLPPEHMIFEFLGQQSRAMDWIFLGAAVLETLFLGLVGLRLSHRVAGPVYRVTQALHQVASGGQPEHIRFRKNDYFPELAQGYNDALDRQSDPNRQAG